MSNNDFESGEKISLSILQHFLGNLYIPLAILLFLAILMIPLFLNTANAALTPITSVTLNSDKATPSYPGAVITFTADASGGNGTPEYKFRVRDSATGIWTTMQGYGPLNTWAWTPSALGTFDVQVQARNVGSGVAYQAVRSLTFTIGSNTVTSVTLTGSKASPVIPGSVIFTATAKGGDGNYEYKFRVKDNSTGIWTTMQGYGPVNTWTWNASTLGSYDVQVQARIKGSGVTYQVFKTLTYSVVSSLITSVDLNANKPSLVPLATVGTVGFTAQAHGGSGSYEYKFRIRPSGTSAWTLTKSYSPDSMWDWTPTTGGSFDIQVMARTAGSTAAYEQVKIVSITITTQPLITAITPTEVKAGSTVRIAGSGFGASKAAGSLTVGGADASSIVSWSDSQIEAVVPDEAMTGTVKARVYDKDSDEKDLVVLWDNENPQNTGIFTGNASPVHVQLLQDGTGGVILVWNDFRNYNSTRHVHIYAQRLNSRGKTTWNSGEIPLAPVAGMQFFPQLISDGKGGAIVVWEETRNTFSYGNDIYAQRIGPSGALLWQSAVPICTAVNGQEKPKIVSDGAGGAIIAWQDNRSGSRFDIYAQRINGDGVPQWTADGVAISTTNNVYPYNLLTEIVADNEGGAIIAWPDRASGTWQIKAQRIDASGTLAWASDGVPVSPTAATQYVSRPVADGSSGAILAWTSSTGDLYAQRISSSGVLQWTSDVLVSGAAGQQSGPQLTTDGAGGAIITWTDTRAGAEDVYAQRVDSSGNVQWATNGVPVCTAASSQYEPQIVSDSRGGAIITWYDYRDYNIPNSGTIQGIDVYAQRLNSEGTAVWQANGTPISAAALHQMYPKIAADNSGGAIIVWEDDRTGSAVNLYAQGISTSGKQ